MEKGRSRKKRKSELPWMILMAVSVLCFLISSVTLITVLLSRKKGADSYKELLQAASVPTVKTEQAETPAKTEPKTTEASKPESTGYMPEETPEEPTIPGETEPEETEEPTTEEFLPVIDFDYLKTINPETCGWIRIPETEIDYPVITSQKYYYGYYETHLFDGSKNSMGCIFLDKSNAAIGTSDNTLIFGHNVRISGIFHDLDFFLRPAYAEQHLDFQIFTPEKNYNCHIICAGGATEDSDLYMTSLSGAAAREKWIAEINKVNRMSNEIKWKDGAKYVTLVTCGSVAGRIAVVAELTEV